MNKTQTQKQNGPGRPRYTPIIPRGQFTFTDLETENGVNPKTGKGKNCTALTLRKWLKRELKNHRHGTVVLLKGTFAEPNGKSGLGHKQYVYQRRTGVAPKAAKTTKTDTDTKASTVPAQSAVSPETQQYEATKAALLANTSVPIAPAETPAPAPEPVAETAPEAVAAPAPVVEAPAETQPLPEVQAAETAAVATEAIAEPVAA